MAAHTLAVNRCEARDSKREWMSRAGRFHNPSARHLGDLDRIRKGALAEIEEK